MDSRQIADFVEERWASSVLPALERYVAIPNQSPAFDPEWASNGHMERALELCVDWVHGERVPNLTLEVHRLPGRTPLLWLEVPGQGDDTVLLYGHIDKQPPMEPWAEGLGPWKPVRRGDRLYGRGAADDGYALFAATLAVAALERNRIPHARCVVLVEACEESGSPDLPAYLETLREKIGRPSLVVCLDSGCGDYERLWVTTSLRGLLNGTLRVRVLDEGVHSGGAGGIVPSSFRIARELLSRLEDSRTGEILPTELHVEVPDSRRRQLVEAAAILGETVHREYPFRPGVRPVHDDPRELLLGRTWKPQLEIIGAGGLPPLHSAGNVLRPETALRVSLRLPPTLDAKQARDVVRRTFETDPPYGAEVSFDGDQVADGWNAPDEEAWLGESLQRASQEFFGRPAAYIGEGGTIPFMAMLGRAYPRAQFVITGVLGPRSNAHGPNEFLHLPTARRLTACVARILADHAARPR
ncbi:MAG: succinyl-diaminopimelate desuccinylase [Candidatus Binatia bacterium]|nr:MAG: succinyl-diaminopimelate desuccinylase [Candidatus Binatia bacterium]